MANMTEAQVRAKLIIDPPAELRFRGPFANAVITTLKLSNPSDDGILFKIKTTAPKRYCVRPNFGCVSPHDTVSVEICLQPFTFDPYEKNKHKFMVQSIVAPSDDKPIDKYVNIWKELPPENFMDAKLKCVFEMPAEAENNRDALAEAATKVEKQKLSKSPPEIKTDEKSSNLDTSDQSESQINDLRQLREEISNLRKENLNLKEQVIRVRSSPSKPTIGEPYAPIVAQKQIPMFYIVIAIAAIFLGIILGKFLL